MTTATLRPQARPIFWGLLLLVLLGSGAMKRWAVHAKQVRDSDVQIAVYRYTTDALAECALWLGRTAIPVRADDVGTHWVRLQLPPVTDIATGMCHRSTLMAM